MAFIHSLPKAVLHVFAPIEPISVLFRMRSILKRYVIAHSHSQAPLVRSAFLDIILQLVVRVSNVTAMAGQQSVQMVTVNVL